LQLLSNKDTFKPDELVDAMISHDLFQPEAMAADDIDDDDAGSSGDGGGSDGDGGGSGGDGGAEEGGVDAEKEEEEE
jgi:hypothetical protein